MINRVCCDVLTQTEAGLHVEQSTQVSVDQADEWTQYTVSQSDQSIQAVCTRFPVAVQVTPQTSNTAVQTSPVLVPEMSDTASQASPVAAEQSETSLFPCTASKNKHNTESEVDDHYKAEKGSVYDKPIATGNSPAVKPLMENIEEMSSNITEQAERSSLESESEVTGHEQAETGGSSVVVYSTEVASNSSAAEPPIKTVESTPSLTDRCQAETGSMYNKEVASSSDTEPPTKIVEETRPSLIDYSSPSDEMQGPQKEQSSSSAPVTAVSSSSLAAQAAAIISTQTEHPPSQNPLADVPAVVQNQSASGVGLQPAFSMSTGTKYIYSFKQRQTFCASNLMPEQSSEIRSQICYGGEASMPNVPTPWQMPLHSSTMTTQTLANQTSVNARPVFETCSATSAVERASEMGSSSHATVTNKSVAAKPLVPVSDGGGSSNQLSDRLQRMLALCTSDRGLGKSKGRNITARKLTSPALLQSVSGDITHNTASLPTGTKVRDSNSASVSSTFQSTACFKELAANVSHQQQAQFATTHGITTAIDAQISATDAKVDSAKSGTGHIYDEKVSESKNVAVSSSDNQLSIGESLSKPTYFKNIGLRPVSSGDKTIPSTGGSPATVMSSPSNNADVNTRAENRAEGGCCNNKEPKSVGLDGNQVVPGESSAAQGRGRRSLYVFRGPLMELDATTLSQSSNSAKSPAASTGKLAYAKLGETVAAAPVKASASKSPYAKLHRSDSTESGARKLPAMLMGKLTCMFSLSLSPSVSLLIDVFTRESSYCFQRVLAIAILSICSSCR